MSRTNNMRRKNIHWRLLTSASAAALLAAAYGASEADAADSDRPPIWIELGGQLDRLGDAQQAFDPSFMNAITIPAQQSALGVQRQPTFAIDTTGQISFQPDGSDWVLSGSIRYGRSQAAKHHHQQTQNAKIPVHLLFTGYLAHYLGKSRLYSFYPYNHVKFADGGARESEHHVILDFQAGKDVGLGLFGGPSVISVGVRYAQFTSKANATLRAIPDLQYPTMPISGTNFAGLYAVYGFKNSPIHFHAYTGIAQIQRSFSGIGPSLSWTASAPIAGRSDNGELAFDWGLDAAMLFGRQTVRGQHKTETISYHGNYWNGEGAPIQSNNGVPVKPGSFFYTGTQFRPPVRHTNVVPIERSRSVSVPNFGGTVGLSYRIKDFKVSMGYRADMFFGAMDGGIDTRKSENRAFYGPYASISIGVGD